MDGMINDDEFSTARESVPARNRSWLPFAMGLGVVMAIILAILTMM